MKIKGPANYSGPPPTETKTDATKAKAEFDPEKVGGESQPVRTRTHQPAPWERGLSEIAHAIKAEGLQGEAVVGKVVDSVLENLFGKEFLSGRDAATMRETLTPFISQDELLMNKLNSVLSRLEKKNAKGG